jgi:hypothetical protein
MKKIILTLAGAIIITGMTLISCKKSSVDSIENKIDTNKSTFNGENKNIHEMRIELTSFKIDVQKQLFNTLTANQKSLIWQDKIKQVISENEFSDYQVELLKELEESISQEIYVVGSKAENNFKEVFHKEWIKKAKGQFNFDDLVNIVANLDDYKHNKGPIAGGGDRRDDCECSIQSDWCMMSMTCKKDICNDSAHGCGTIWTFSCKGMCRWN